jgi:hypothetical protein
MLASGKEAPSRCIITAGRDGSQLLYQLVANQEARHGFASIVSAYTRRQGHQHGPV